MLGFTQSKSTSCILLKHCTRFCDLIFSSLQYLIFLPLAVLAYWQTRGSARLFVVVATSYIFYMSWIPAYGVLLLAFTLFNWFLGKGISKSLNTQRSIAKAYLICGLLVNVGALCYYKYANFFFENITALINQARHTHLDPIVLNVMLPLGISFFVFEFVHYLADVYKGKKPVQSFLEFAAFASFFPSQIAGPIKRYEDFVAKLRAPQKLDRPLFYEGTSLIMQGLFKKAALADPIAAIISRPFSTTDLLSAPDAWLAALGFALQVYCDFSGYTDMGRGSALLMGIRLPENFDLPFFSKDLTEFWRKWHMSLGSWLRDYVYIPLGGSRSGRFGLWRNLMITMMVCGFWHGASWHYLFFGATQGFGLIVHREYEIWAKTNSQAQSKIAVILGSVFTFLFVITTYSLFRAPDLAGGALIWRSFINFANLDCTMAEPLLKSGVLVIGATYFIFWLILSNLREHSGWLATIFSAYQNQLRIATWASACILVMASKPMEAVPFVYFQF